VGCATGRRKVVSASSRATLVGSKDNGGKKGLFFMTVLRRTQICRGLWQRPLLKSHSEEWTSNGDDVRDFMTIVG